MMPTPFTPPPEGAHEQAIREDALREVQKVGDEVRAFREKYPDSPLTGVAFNLAALCGEIEATIRSKESAP